MDKVDGKRRLGAQLTPAQRLVAELSVHEEGLGYKAIIRKFPNYGPKEQGLRSAVERLRDTGALGRKEGIGRKRSRGPPDAAKADRQFFADNRTAACGDLRKALDIPRIATRGNYQRGH